MAANHIFYFCNNQVRHPAGTDTSAVVELPGSPSTSNQTPGHGTAAGADQQIFQGVSDGVLPTGPYSSVEAPLETFPSDGGGLDQAEQGDELQQSVVAPTPQPGHGQEADGEAASGMQRHIDKRDGPVTADQPTGDVGRDGQHGDRCPIPDQPVRPHGKASPSCSRAGWSP